MSARSTRTPRPSRNSSERGQGWPELRGRSDGAPLDEATLEANDSQYLERHLRSVVERIEQDSRVELAAIGIPGPRPLVAQSSPGSSESLPTGYRDAADVDSR